MNLITNRIVNGDAIEELKKLPNNNMNFLKQFDSFGLEIGRHNRKTYNRKSGIVWGNKGNTGRVILYLSKPRNMKQEDFEDILEHIQISFKR